MRQKQQQADDERVRRKTGDRSTPPRRSKPEPRVFVVDVHELKTRKRPSD